MLLWPVVAVLGFFLLAALVVTLAQSSTARYEFERNGVQGQRQQAAVLATVGAAAAGSDVAVAAAPVVPAPLPVDDDEVGLAASAAAHPAGKRVVDTGTPAWWLVQEDDRRELVVAGPFDDRIEAEWAALAGGLAEPARAVHGVLRADGRLVRRQLPEERAWLNDLGDQLDRLPEEWDSPLADEDALVTLVVEVASALVEAGLQLHDCAGSGPAGGVCLSPEPGRPGVLVSWQPHERMSREQVYGAEVHAAVQEAMNAAVADCLHRLGFQVEPFGTAGCVLVVVGEG